jgi:hypothetical protein
MVGEGVMSGPMSRWRKRAVAANGELAEARMIIRRLEKQLAKAQKELAKKDDEVKG